MTLICAFLYVSGLPMAWHHMDNCFEARGEKPSALAIFALVFCWPTSWISAYIYSFSIVLWERVWK